MQSSLQSFWVFWSVPGMDISVQLKKRAWWPHEHHVPWLLQRCFCSSSHLLEKYPDHKHDEGHKIRLYLEHDDPSFLPFLFSLPPQVQKMTFWQAHECFSGSAHISQETGFSCRVKGEKKKKGTNKTSDTVAMTHQRQDECAGEDTAHQEKGGQEAGRAAERARQHILGSDGHHNSSGTSEPCQLSHCQTLCHISDSWGTGKKNIWETRCQGWAAEGGCHLCMSHLALSSSPENTPWGCKAKGQMISHAEVSLVISDQLFSLLFVGFTCLCFFWVLKPKLCSRCTILKF